MNQPEVPPGLQPLLMEVIDGTLDPEAASQLQELLRTDPHAMSLYIDFCEMHAALAWENGQVIADITPAVVDHKRTWIRSAPLLRMVAIAATLLVIASSGWLLRHSNTMPTGPVVASIEQSVHATIFAGKGEWTQDEIRAGLYVLKQGLVQIKYATGVTVYLEAPAKFEAVDGKRMVLHEGRLSANVPPEGVGFTVETEEAEVVDFGTEFSVEALGGQSEVHVFDGHVRVQPKDSVDQPSEAVDLWTDEAVRIADTTRQASGIDLARYRFIRSIKEPKAAYVDAVRDLSPTAYYRMPIRQQGLHCFPEEYSGQVLTGEGRRPACAPGFSGGSLRVGGRSIGRGAIVHNAPEIASEFTIMAWVYAEGRARNAVLATNITKNNGCFTWMLDDDSGRLKIRLRDQEGELVECVTQETIELKKWHHFACTYDGDMLTLFRNGEMIQSQPCESLAESRGSPLHFGTNWRGKHRWEGRIDEVAIFDKALSHQEIDSLMVHRDPSQL
ncbi:MAG: FecR domain-containing protein [Rubripirellula sp.]|nr:FecR domain-containing protein [Rubripirellula sp.]